MRTEDGITGWAVDDMACFEGVCMPKTSAAKRLRENCYLDGSRPAYLLEKKALHELRYRSASASAAFGG